MIWLSACTLGQKDMSKDANPTTGSALTMQDHTYEENLKMTSSKIKDSEEFKSCMNMNVPMCINNAGMQLAQKSESAEFCNELNTPDQKNSCVFAVTLIKVQKNNDKSLCETLTEDYRKQCIRIAIRSEATAKKDVKICDSLKQKTGTGESLVLEDSSANECMMAVLMSDSTTSEKSCNILNSTQIKEMCIASMRTRNPLESTGTTIQN